MFNVNAIVSALNQIRDVIKNNFATPSYCITPTGAIDGANTVFTLPDTPVTNSLQLFLNGAFQTGGGVDYTIAGLTITFVGAPPAGSILRAFLYH